MLGRRTAQACHLNALESFPAFAVAVVLCKLQKAKPLEAARLSLRFLLARALYTACYLLGSHDAVAALRSLCWLDSVLSIGRLYGKALTASKIA